MERLPVLFDPPESLREGPVGELKGGLRATQPPLQRAFQEVSYGEEGGGEDEEEEEVEDVWELGEERGCGLEDGCVCRCVVS